ncbi:MAG: hypothetical protein ACC618_01360, partial [Patescibacteria group bacterium]
MPRQESEKSIDRRGVIKLGAATLTGAALAVALRERADSLKVDIYQPLNLQREERELLIENGIGNFIPFLDKQRQFNYLYGYELFPNISSIIESAAVGNLSRETPEVSALSDGWPLERDPDMTLRDAQKIAENILVVDAKDEELIRESLVRLASVLPNIMLLFPDRLEIRGDGHLNFSKSRIQINEPLSLSPEHSRHYFHALIHESSHAFDTNNLTYEDLIKLKKYVRKSDIVNYLTTYVDATSEILDYWINSTPEEARAIKDDKQLLKLTVENLADQARYKFMAWSATRTIITSGSEIKEIAEQMGIYGDIHIRDYWNIVAREYIKKLSKAYFENPQLHQKLRDNRQLKEFRELIIGEVTHNLVGPFYGSWRKMIPILKPVTPYFLAGASLEISRLQLFTADGKILRESEIKAALTEEPNLEFTGAQPLIGAEMVQDSGAHYIGNHTLERVMPDNPEIFYRFHAFEMPQSPFIKGRIFTLIKQYNLLKNPEHFSFYNSVILLSDRYKQHGSQANLTELNFNGLDLLVDLDEIRKSQSAPTEFFHSEREVVEVKSNLFGKKYDRVNDRKVGYVPLMLMSSDGGYYVNNTLSFIYNKQFQDFIYDELPALAVPISSEETLLEMKQASGSTISATVFDFGNLKVVHGLGEPYSVVSVDIFDNNSKGVASRNQHRKYSFTLGPNTPPCLP